MKRNLLSRRALLRGAGGLCVALPLLEYTHGDVWACPGNGTACRFVVFFSHGGTISCRDRQGNKENGSGDHHGWDLWAPTDPGPELSTLGEEMTPLQAFASDLILLRGVDNKAGTLAPFGGGHNFSNVTAMTCADVQGSDGNELPLGPSLDQVLAERLGLESVVPFPSIDLKVAGQSYGTPFFRAATEEVSSETDPKAAFDRLFEGVTPSDGEPDPELVRIRAAKKSVLDGVLEGFQQFQKKVGAADAHLLEAHADHIRGMEQQLAALESLAACTIPDVSSAPDSDRVAELVAPLHVDILVHALRCGLTQVATLQIADIITDWLPTPFGSDLGHALGHAARDIGASGPKAGQANAWRTEAVANRQWRMQMFARLLDGLKQTPEGAGTMLDNSVVLFTSEFGTASVHSVRDVPILLAGTAGGRWTTGRHVNYNQPAQTNPNTLAYQTEVSTHNVFTSVLRAFGYPDTHFGNGTASKTGALAELP